MPAFFSLSAAAKNSGQVFGTVAPAFLKASGLAHSQFTRCTLTGAATYLPLYFITRLTTGGSCLSQLPARATASMSASTPSAPHSWIAGPLIWAAVGGLPDTTRVFSAVIALSPPPPATAKSFQVTPWALIIFFSSATDLASPPEVHQCRTSTSAAWAATGNRLAASTAALRRFSFITLSFCSCDVRRDFFVMRMIVSRRRHPQNGAAHRIACTIAGT